MRAATGLARPPPHWVRASTHVTATATDPAGNTSPVSAPKTFTVDTVAPGAPVVTSPAEGSTTANPTPNLAGTAEPDSTVT